MQKSGYVDDDTLISALDVFYEMDGRKSRYIKNVLDWHREEDARDLGGNKLNQLVGTQLSTLLRGKLGKMEK